MDEPKAEAVQPEPRKEWLTPELIIEDVSDITHGGSGGQPVFGGENKITTYYHS
jgi:hypothetical protein